MKQRIGEDYARENKDRLGDVATGPGLGRDFHIGIPPLDTGRALEQAEAVYGLLNLTGLDGYICDVCFDTTATNSGCHGRVVILLQHLLGKALLCCPCRRHITELLGKFGMVGATGQRSTAPGDALLQRFCDAWPEIWSHIDYTTINDILVRFPWDQWEGTELEAHAREAREILGQAHLDGTFQRGEYKHACFLILMALVTVLRSNTGYRFPDLAKVSNARFLQRMLYFVMMFLLLQVPAVARLFSEPEKVVIRRMAVFCMIYYGPHFLTSTSASRAANNDLRLIQKLSSYKMYDNAIASPVLEVMDRHTEYLSPQLVVLSLANKDLQDQERSDIANALNVLKEEWGGEEFQVQEVNRPGPYLASSAGWWADGMPSLSSFVSVQSFLLFSLLGQQPVDLAWMERPVSEWENYPQYLNLQDYVASKHVVNDAVERFIGVTKPRVSNFRNETNLQSNLLTTVKVRNAYPHTKKDGVVKTWKTKAEMNQFKPSDLLVREEDQDLSSNSKDDVG